MQSEPRWISPDELIALNQIVVEDTGEPHFVRDLGLLESSAAVPKNRWAYAREEDLVLLAAGLMFSVARNHPFEQGNKRTAFLAFDAMLKANGWGLDIPDTAAVAEEMVAVIEHKVDEGAFAERLRPHVLPRG